MRSDHPLPSHHIDSEITPYNPIYIERSKKSAEDDDDRNPKMRELYVQGATL